MTVRWTSFPYQARFTDPALEIAERSAATPPDQLCQTQRHILAVNPAAYLELMYSDSGEDMTIHRAWFTCSGCHAALEAEYEPDIG